MTWRDAGSKPALMATERPFGMGGFELPQPFCADSTITACRLVALAKPHFGEDRLLGIVRDPQIFMQRCATTSPASFGSRGYTIEAAMPSPIVSGDGYREFLIIARREAP